MTGVIGGVSVDADRMYAALESGFSQATDLAAPTVAVICDNATIHHSGVTTRLLAAHPRLLLVEGARYCPRDNPIRQLVRLAKIRWRVEHEDREMKHGLGLDHYQGSAWHHYLPLVTAAHGFYTLRCLDPKAQTPAWPSYQVLTTRQKLLRCWTGACPTCHRDLPAQTPPQQHPSEAT